MCSRKWDIPVVPGTSLRPPTWYQTQSETTGACLASSACITSPLSRRRVAGTSVRGGTGKSLRDRASGYACGPDRRAAPHRTSSRGRGGEGELSESDRWFHARLKRGERGRDGRDRLKAEARRSEVQGIEDPD